jgi:hypothetical protein
MYVVVYNNVEMYWDVEENDETEVLAKGKE